jgi:hypothetical protein
VDGGVHADGIVIGGGAILDEALADRIKVLDTPRVERVIAGAAGVSDAWRDFVASCVAVGVATDEDVAVVQGWGFPATRTGTPADDVTGTASILGALREGMA